ncbi:NAD(P)H-binding protein [Streptomyces mirabilis]|uniref:NAD(P)H-binding protein n=1 Tax=Streptomyces mirabilis TaxID=68239 RepID=UPI00341EAC40
MNVFVIGATGFVGGTLARRLTAREHLVTGLARTDVAAVALAADGITPVVADRDSRRSATIDAALRADAVVYTAQADPVLETATVESLTRAMALAGPGGPGLPQHPPGDPAGGVGRPRGCARRPAGLHAQLTRRGRPRRPADPRGGQPRDRHRDGGP